MILDSVHSSTPKNVASMLNKEKTEREKDVNREMSKIRKREWNCKRRKLD